MGVRTPPSALLYTCRALCPRIHVWVHAARTGRQLCLLVHVPYAHVLRLRPRRSTSGEVHVREAGRGVSYQGAYLQRALIGAGGGALHAVRVGWPIFTRSHAL
jgi:hypothetical protein